MVGRSVGLYEGVKDGISHLYCHRESDVLL